MSIAVRVAGARDIDAVMRIMEDAFDPAFGEAWTASQCLGLLGLPGVHLLIAFAGETPAGFSLARVVLDAAELLLLAVRPEYRRQGVARLLIGATKDMLRAAGAERMHLEVRRGNSAMHVYSASGFVQTGTRPAYYRGKDGQAFDALSYATPLVRAE